MEVDLDKTMNRQFYFNGLFLFLLLTVLCCLAVNADCKNLQANSSSAFHLTTNIHSKYKAAAITLQGDAIIEIATFEPGIYSISRINLFFHSPLDKKTEKFNATTPDINLLTLIRKDNLFLSILRI